MSQSQITYEASIYERVVKYRNFKGVVTELTLYFALDPLQLMQAIASFAPPKSKSQNPSKRNNPEISDEDQITFIRKLAQQAAGFPSDDGESWEPFEDFQNTLAGKAFLTQLVSSDADRQGFAEKVILQPFRDYVGFAKADVSNSPKEIAQLESMVSQMENVFKSSKPENETVDERRERLLREIDSLGADDSNVVPGQVLGES